MCPGRDPRPPQARQELAVGGAFLGSEAHHAHRPGAHRRPPLRGRPRLGEQQVRRRLATQLCQGAYQDGGENETEDLLYLKAIIEPTPSVVDILETLIHFDERQRVVEAVP